VDKSYSFWNVILSVLSVLFVPSQSSKASRAFLELRELRDTLNSVTLLPDTRETDTLLRKTINS